MMEVAWLGTDMRPPFIRSGRTERDSAFGRTNSRPQVHCTDESIPPTTISSGRGFHELFPLIFCVSPNRRPRHRWLVSGTGIATMSLRPIATPGRSRGVSCDRFSIQRLNPSCHSASACSAEVLPELFGPMNTTRWPSSMSTVSNRLKFRISRRVSIQSQRTTTGPVPEPLAVEPCGMHPTIVAAGKPTMKLSPCRRTSSKYRARADIGPRLLNG